MGIIYLPITYMCLKCMVNLGKFDSPLDPSWVMTYFFQSVFFIFFCFSKTNDSTQPPINIFWTSIPLTSTVYPGRLHSDESRHLLTMAVSWFGSESRCYLAEFLTWKQNPPKTSQIFDGFRRCFVVFFFTGVFLANIWKDWGEKRPSVSNGHEKNGLIFLGGSNRNHGTGIAFTIKINLKCR